MRAKLLVFSLTCLSLGLCSVASAEGPGPCGWYVGPKEGATITVPAGAPVVFHGSYSNSWNCGEEPPRLGLDVKDIDGATVAGAIVPADKRVVWVPEIALTPGATYTMTLDYWSADSNNSNPDLDETVYYNYDVTLQVTELPLGAPPAPGLTLELWEEEDLRLACCPDDDGGESCVPERCDYSLEGLVRMTEPPAAPIAEGVDEGEYWVYRLEKRFDAHEARYVYDFIGWVNQRLERDLYLNLDEPYPTTTCVRLTATPIQGGEAVEVVDWTCVEPSEVETLERCEVAAPSCATTANASATSEGCSVSTTRPAAGLIPLLLLGLGLVVARARRG